MFFTVLFRTCICVFCAVGADSQCAFPSQLRGVWKGADRGDTNFVNSTYLSNYAVNIPNVGYFDFSCLEQRGSKYFVKARQENNIFGVIVKFYMCLEIYGVDPDVAYYYQLTAYDPYLQDNVVGVANADGTYAMVCNGTAVRRNFITLVRGGSVADGSMNNTCPEVLESIYANVSIQQKTEAQPTICPGTHFDVCTDKTLINITYNATCATTAKAKTLSARGVYRCIHSITEGSDTYLAIWNDDTGFINPFSCFAFQRIGDIVYATETPKFCGKGSNSSVAEIGGVRLVIWDIIDTCKVIVTTTPAPPPDLAFLWFLVVFPIILLLLAAILIARLCYKRYGCICKKIKLPKRKPKPQPIVDDGTGKPDVVGNITFVPSVIKPAKLYNFRTKKPLNTFFPLFDPEWNPTDIPNLQPVAKVEPLYKDTLEDYMKGRLPRRPSGTSLYSFHA